MPRFPAASFDDPHSDTDVETASTAGHSTPSTSTTAVFHGSDEPFLLRRNDSLATLLRISNALATASFCCAIPLLGASSLFQTPFVSTSTLEFNRNILNPPAPSPERELLIKKQLWAGDDDYINESGDREPQRSKEARRLSLRWAMVACVVAAISGVWTFFYVREYGGGPGLLRLSGWLYVAWAEVVLDAMQVVVMWLVGSRCRRREGVGRDQLEEGLRRFLECG